MHVPTATKVTVVPDTVHTEVVVEAKLTASPDEAVALTVNGAVPNASFVRAPNVMVWLPCVTDTVHTEVVVEAKLTASPDDAVADRERRCPIGPIRRAPNVMV